MGKTNHYKKYSGVVDDFTSHEDRKDRRKQRKQKTAFRDQLDTNDRFDCRNNSRHFESDDEYY